MTIIVPWVRMVRRPITHNTLIIRIDPTHARRMHRRRRDGSIVYIVPVTIFWVHWRSLVQWRPFSMCWERIIRTITTNPTLPGAAAATIRTYKHGKTRTPNNGNNRRLGIRCIDSSNRNWSTFLGKMFMRGRDKNAEMETI